jgi:hypothetical protein
MVVLELAALVTQEKQSFEKLEGQTQAETNNRNKYVFDDGNNSPGPTGGVSLPNLGHQSAVLATGYSDGLGSWSTRPYYQRSITPRNNRVRVEETLDEFISSERTTTRELITYAQISHFGYAASEAVIPGAIIPSENYYASSSAVGGSTLGGLAGYHSQGLSTTADGSKLLPVSRSFYSQAIKLGATNNAWCDVGVGTHTVGESIYWLSAGAGSRSAWTGTPFNYEQTITSPTTPKYGLEFYSTSSDQAKTQYMVAIGSHGASPTYAGPPVPYKGRGIMGSLTRTGTSGPIDHNNTATWGGNAMFKDPGAGSGNGLFWRFSEYDQYGDDRFDSYSSGKPLMRVWRWEQWFENPVYGGARTTWIDTSTIAGTQWPPAEHGAPSGDPGTHDGDYTGGTGEWEGVAPGFAPISVPWTIGRFEPSLSATWDPTLSGSHCGGKLNFMQIDWRYQCGVHYNSAMDVAPIGLTPGKRHRSGRYPHLVEGEKLDTRWYEVGGRAFSDRAGHSAQEVTGSDFIGSMVSSASQPWLGTAINRSGFSIITSPTTPVPSGTHPDYSNYGSFRAPGLITIRALKGGYCSVAMPLYKVPDVYSTSSIAIPVKSWLSSGLSRDLDVEVGWGFTHKRKDLAKGLAGFTILTASTVSPPGDLAGRFNGDHKLRATFKEKRLLNAQSFRLVSNIKSQPASNADSSELFCFTVPALNSFLIGTASVTSRESTRHGTFGDNSRFSNDRLWWRAYGVSNQYIGDTTAVDWTSLVGNPPTLTSGRRYVAAIAANTPVYDPHEFLVSGTDLQLARTAIPQQAPGPGLFRVGFSANINFANPNVTFDTDVKADTAASGDYIATQNPHNLSARLGKLFLTTGNPTNYTTEGISPEVWSKSYIPYTSSSLASDEPKTSLYLLMPGDEIVLGFQPSLHGSNRGNSTIPANPNVNPYGPWRDGVFDRQEIPTGSSYNPEWDYTGGSPGFKREEKVDSRGQGGYHLRRGASIIKGGKSVNNANMETLYEPRSSFTIKKSRNAKLVLYGTLLRNNKHVPPLNDVVPQRTAAIHEAIMGAPIVDQYQIEPTYAYTGSYIAHHITGSILMTQRNKFAMGLPPGSAALWLLGAGGVIPLANSIYDPTSPKFIPLGGPYARNDEYIRRVWKPSARENDKKWIGWVQGQHKPKAGSTSISMGISGSIQRFVRLADDSEFYYDSFPPNPAALYGIDYKVSGSCNTNPAAEESGQKITKIQVQKYDSGGVDPLRARAIINLSTTNQGNNTSGLPMGNQPLWANPYAVSSFPFDHQYRDVPREITTSPVFRTTGSYAIAVAPGSVLTERIETNGKRIPNWTPDSALVNSIRIAGLNRRIRPAVSMGTPGWGVYLTADQFWINDPDESLSIFSQQRRWRSIEDMAVTATVAAFGWWKTDFGDRILPTLGSGIPDAATYTDTDGIHTGLPGQVCLFDHPSGWKYGLINYRKTASSAVFRHDSFGQFRDMLEQRKYTKFYEMGDEFNPSGLQESAVSCIFVDGDGMPTDNPLQTTCLNVSQEMTSSIPYKEGETARTFLFNRQLVTISPLVQSFTASPFLNPNVNTRG